MASDHDHHKDFEITNSSYSSTPKLSLSKLPNKPIRNNNYYNKNQALLAAYTTTPPIHPSVSIPFQWEEAPGKPKSPTNKSKTVRCLDLPPRLLNDICKITNTPSPTTVLDGPYVGRSFSSINEAVFVEKKEAEISGDGDDNKDNMMIMRSWRWENLKENSKGVVKGNFDFSGPLSSSSACDFDTHQRKLLSFRRKGSFFNFSRTNSDLLGGIYESFKQVVPWRWKRAKNKKSV